MKKLLKFLCGRIFITGLLLLLQAVWLGVFFWKLAAYSVWLNAAFTLLSLLIVLHILYHDDVSGFKIGWIILILQLPVMGGLLYLLFGGASCPRTGCGAGWPRSTRKRRPRWGRTRRCSGRCAGTSPVRRRAAGTLPLRADIRSVWIRT